MTPGELIRAKKMNIVIGGIANSDIIGEGELALILNSHPEDEADDVFTICALTRFGRRYLCKDYYDAIQ